jgi:hypothetical protein
MFGVPVVEIPVVIEPLADRRGFTASLAGPIQLSAQADTADEAHRQLAALLERRMQESLQLRALNVPGAAGHGSEPGWLPDDGLTRDWLQHVQSYRDECDAADRARLGAAPAEETLP